MKSTAVGLLVALFAVPMAIQPQPVAGERVVKPTEVWQGVVTGMERIDLIYRPMAREVANERGALHPSYACDNTMDFAKLWMLVKRPGQPPQVDFNRFTAIVVFEIADDLTITEGNGKTRLDFKVGYANGKPEQPYTIAVFPRSSVQALPPAPSS